MAQPLKVVKPIPITDAILHATDVAEADYPVYSPSTHYALGDRVIMTTTHKIYQSLENANLGHQPDISPLNWAEVSATNRWKMFDGSSTTATTFTTSAYYEFDPGQTYNSLSLLNIAGVSSVRIRMTDPAFGLVYDQTVPVNSIVSESSWYTWFFELRTQVTQVIKLDLPTYPNARLRVDLYSSGTGSVGVMLFGRVQSIGLGVQQGARLGIQDFSRKERNEWGDIELVQRAFAKRLNIDTYIENQHLDYTYSLLATLRATPCLWVAEQNYSSLVVYGFFNNFELNIAYPLHSDCSIDIEGLV